MVHRHKKAFKRSAIMAAILSIPLAFTIYVKGEYRKTIEDQTNSEVGQFYFETQEGLPFSHMNLRNHVSLLAVIPDSCDGCTSGLFDRVGHWAEEHLSYQGIKKVPYQLLALGPLPEGCSGNWVKLAHNNRESFAEQVRPFLGNKEWDNKLMFVLIDEHANLRGIFDQEPDSWESLTRLWSQVTFNHYLSDYLSKRTFFGPKKESRYSLH